MTTRKVGKQDRLPFPGTKAPLIARAPFAPRRDPGLKEFIDKHAHSISPGDSWSPKAFEDDLVGQKTSALYTLHPYWSKKDPSLINKYVLHYTKPGDLVVDPFAGSGTTGLAALLSERSVLLIDASPSAALLSHFCCLPGSPEDVESALERLLAKAGAEVDNLYLTKCDRCGGSALVEYVIWSDRFQCPLCAEFVPLADCPEEKVELPVTGSKGKTQLRTKRVCPLCLGRNGGKPNKEFIISTRAKKSTPVPVLVRYKCKHCRPTIGERRHNDDQRTRKGKFFYEIDLAKLDAIDSQQIPYWYPSRKMMDVDDNNRPWGVEWRPGRDFRSIADLYTKRNLWALAALRKALGDEDFGQLETLLFTGLLHKCSHLMGCGGDQVGRVKMGTYYMAPIRMECRPTKYLREALSDIKRHFEAKLDVGYQGGNLFISASDAHEELQTVPDDVVDYVFTDPPYVGKIQYGELNFVWEAWLGFDGAWLAKEIVVNPFRGKDLSIWEDALRKVLAEVYRVLKPGRWLSLCYHDTDPKTWTLVQNILRDVGFEIGTVTAQSTSQKSSNQITGEKVVKSDLVVNCRKLYSDIEQGQGAEIGLTSVSDRVREIVIEMLSQAAGQARDRLWDVVLKRLLARGQMAEHRFDDILGEVAFRSESGRWFLKEEFESLSENDIKNEERTGEALIKFARLRMAGVPATYAAELVLRAPHLADAPIDEKQVEVYIRDSLIKDKKSNKYELKGRLRGVEFYDCLFFYLTRWLKGRPTGKTPRRNLAEFLGEYLVRFKDGDKWLYRAPDEAELQSLKKARQTGLGRRIRQYVSFLRGDGEYPKERMPDAKTLVAWLKHAAAFGLADEGVLLWEKGGLIGQLKQLSEDERYDAEDYYTQCKRRASKSSGVGEDSGDDEIESEEESDE